MKTKNETGFKNHHDINGRFCGISFTDGRQDMIVERFLDLDKPASELLVPCPFVMACVDCDATSFDRKEALAEGWKNISFAPEYASFSYLGDCPDCIAENGVES